MQVNFKKIDSMQEKARISPLS